MDAGEQTYEAAGVSIAKADAVIERLRAAVESTGATGFGAFAGLHPLDGDRFLAAVERMKARERAEPPSLPCTTAARSRSITTSLGDRDAGSLVGLLARVHGPSVQSAPWTSRPC